MRLEKKRLLILLLLCIISFTNKAAYTKSFEKFETYKIIKIVDGDTFYIDFNNDGIPQKEEKSRLNGVNAFEMKYYKGITDKEKKEFNLSYEEIYGLGYLGKKFATDELLNKPVRVIFSSKSKKDFFGRNLVSIYYGKNYSKNFEKELLKEGLASIYYKSNIAQELKPYLDTKKIQKNVDKTHSLTILNKKNNKYHKLNCKYGQAAKDFQLVTINKAKKHYKAAACCFHEEELSIHSTKKRIPKLKETGNIKFFYIRARDYQLPSLQTRTEAGQALIEIINNAQKTIDFAFYGLSEQPELLEALLNAQKRGVKIRGVIDMNIKGYNDYKDTANSIIKFSPGTIKTDLASDLRKKAKIENNEIKYYGKYYGHIMHNKFCIVDKKIVWTGTANLSMTGIGGFNENTALLIHSKNIADIYRKEMDEMYEKEKFHEEKNEIYTKAPLLINNTEVDVYFSPTKHAIFEGIIPEIRNSKDYIYISMFLISHRQLVNELIKAKERGVDVKLITEANHALAPYSLHEKLRQNGVPVKVENWPGKMHAKLAVIDDSNIIVGSTNWTKSGFQYNDENLLILRNNTDAAKFLRNEFISSWNSIPDKWLTANPKPEGVDSPGSCSDGLDNDYNGLIDAEDTSCKGVEGATYPTLQAKQRLIPKD